MDLGVFVILGLQHPLARWAKHLCRAWLMFLVVLGGISAVPSSAEAQDRSWPDRIVTLPRVFTGTLSLRGFVDAAIDTDGGYQFSDLLTTDRSAFKPIAGQDINLGFIQATIWMRFAIRTAADTEKSQTLLLSVLPNFTDFLDVYTAIERPGLQVADFNHVEMGDHTRLPQGAVNGLSNILPLKVTPGKTLLVYVRAKNLDSSLNLSLAAYSSADSELRSALSNLAQGAWFGGMTILFVTQMVFFCFDRQRCYLLLAFYILATTLVYFGGLGLSRVLLFPGGGAGNDYFIGISSWSGLTAGALSIAALLRFRERYRWLNRLFVSAAFVGVAGIMFVLVGANRFYTPLAGSTILVITSVAMIVALVDFWRARTAEDGLNLAAFTLLWIGLVFTNGQRYGIFDLPNSVAQSYAMFGLAHFVLLTGGLAARLRRTELARREADRRAVAAAHDAQRWANDQVIEKTRELVGAKRAAEAALGAELDARTREIRLMEVISHQYRTPLAAIRSSIESVGFTLPAEDLANRERLERAWQNIDRLVEVLEVNLARSRLQGSSFSPRMETFPIVNVVNASVDRAHDLLQGADIQADMSSEARDLQIHADPDMLALALINLIENAVKFSREPSGIRLQVELEAGQCILRVCDRGIGIPADEVDRVMAQGVRGSNASHVEGTGMGLSLVSRIVAAHAGTFALKPAAGGGTVAEIKVPTGRI